MLERALGIEKFYHSRIVTVCIGECNFLELERSQIIVLDALLNTVVT